MRFALKRYWLPALLILSLMLLSACGGNKNTATNNNQGASSQPQNQGSNDSGGQADEKPMPRADIEIANIATGGNALPILAAQEKGFFEEQNLNVRITIMSGTAATTAVNSGSVPIGVLDTGAGLISYDKGAPVRMVADYIVQAPYDLMAQPQYESIQDLKGTMIGTTAPNNIITIFTDKLLQDGGLKREDYDYIFSGGNNERFAALQSGGVAAALLSDPGNFLAADAGFVTLGNTTQSFPKISFDSFWVNKNWSDQNEDVLVRFLKAMIKAQHWIYDPNNKEEAMQLLLNEDPNATPEAAERGYNAKLVDNQIFTKNGDVDKEAMDIVLDINKQLENFQGPDVPKQEDFFESRFLERAQKELGIN